MSRARLIRLVLIGALALVAVLELVGERKVWIDEATLDPVYAPRLLPTPDGSPHLLPTPDGREHGLDDPAFGGSGRRLPGDWACFT